MSRPLFYHSILRYEHSALTGESLNIGVLLVFPSEMKVLFQPTTRLKRVADAYNLGRDWISHINSYLRSFIDSTEKINQSEPIEFELLAQNTNNIIDSLFIPRDSTSLRFSPFKKKYFVFV